MALGSTNDTDMSFKATIDQPDQDASGARAAALGYYDAPATNSFYHSIGGGEHAHIGIYDSPTDTIMLASQRAVERMAGLAAPITSATRVLEVGAGYGGAARWLARQYGCKVTCLNLSEVQNEWNRAKNQEQGLDALIDVVDGVFEHLPFVDSSFDLVWCQDCLIHSSDRKAAVAEMSRVLVPHGAHVVLTDHTTAQDTDAEALALVTKRLSLGLYWGTRKEYQDKFRAQGFETVSHVEATEHMISHYSNLSSALQDLGQLPTGVSRQFAENAGTRFSQWVDGGKQGQLEWGLFHFRR